MGVELLNVFHLFVGPFNNETVEGFQQVQQRGGGILGLLIVQGCRHAAKALLPLQGAVNSGDLLHELNLQLQQIFHPDICRVVGDLLGCRYAWLGLIDDHAVELGPLLGDIFHAHVVRDEILRKHQHPFCAGPNHPVGQGDQPVDVALLIDHVADEAVYLAVDKGVQLDDVGVAPVCVGGFSFTQDMPKGGQVAVVPVVVDKPFVFDQRDVVVGDACRPAILQAFSALMLSRLLTSSL